MNSWAGAFINQKSHVQLGEFIMIPEDERSTTSDVSDTTVSDTWETADLGGMVPEGTTAVYGFMFVRTTSTNDRALLLTRGFGQSITTAVGAYTSWVAAQIGASADIVNGIPFVINAPSGKFQYRRFSSIYPITTFEFNLWGYYVK